MVQHVKSMKPDNRYYKVLTDWYDEPLEGFELLEGWKSCLRTVFISMNSCDPSLFMATAKEVSPQQLQTQIQQQINKTNCIENITKRMKESEADPKFLPDLIEKFQTKLFAKLKEFDSGLPWHDKKQIPINFVCNFESGKKFEVKCPYCSSALVVYWRYQQATSNADVFYPKFNDSNYFKHMMRHWNGNLNTTPGNTRSAVSEFLFFGSICRLKFDTITDFKFINIFKIVLKIFFKKFISAKEKSRRLPRILPSGYIFKFRGVHTAIQYKN